MLIYGTLAGIAYALQNAEEMRRQAERAAKAEALRARASLEAMRSQLNPHFILNTFHALVGLVRQEPAIAESALERLGDPECSYVRDTLLPQIEKRIRAQQ